MGNICTRDEEKIEYLESRLEEQITKMEDLMNENRLLKRENSYLVKLSNRRWHQTEIHS